MQRHIWEEHEVLADDARYISMWQKLYPKCKEALLNMP